MTCYYSLELANMHIMDEEKSVPRDLRKKPSTHHQKPPRPHPTDFNGNIKPVSHPATQKPQRRAPLDPYYAPYTAQGTFTPTPRLAPYHQTAEHDSDVPEDSMESGHVQQTGHQIFRDHDERPGMDEERVFQSHDTSSLSSRNQGDQVTSYISTSLNWKDLERYLHIATRNLRI
jgi:hypothetical protein